MTHPILFASFNYYPPPVAAYVIAIGGFGAMLLGLGGRDRNWAFPMGAVAAGWFAFLAGLRGHGDLTGPAAFFFGALAIPGGAILGWLVARRQPSPAPSPTANKPGGGTQILVAAAGGDHADTAGSPVWRLIAVIALLLGVAWIAVNGVGFDYQDNFGRTHHYGFQHPIHMMPIDGRMLPDRPAPRDGKAWSNLAPALHLLLSGGVHWFGPRSLRFATFALVAHTIGIMGVRPEGFPIAAVNQLHQAVNAACGLVALTWLLRASLGWWQIQRHSPAFQE